MWLLAVLVMALGLGVRADYVPQPSDWYSTIECYDETAVYDDELAALMAHVAGSHGYTSFAFIFTQCHSGGMLDDLATMLRDAGDVALLSASRHDEVAWRAVTTDRVTCLQQSGLTVPEAYFAAVVTRALARTGDDLLTMAEVWQMGRDQGAARPGGPATHPKICPGESRVDPPEHAQWLAVAEGGAIRLGFNAQGQEIPRTNRHAVLFMGEGDSIADWNDLDLIYTVLLTHGFAPEHVVVLAGPGPGGVMELDDPEGDLYVIPAYVDGSGTRDALLSAFDALPSITGAEGQLFFWVGGHGDHGPRIAWDEAVTLSTKRPMKGRFAAQSYCLEDGSSYDLYVFVGERDDVITLTMTSWDVDAFLWLYDDARQVLVTDDDGAGGTDALITLVLPYDGLYYVLANTFDAREYGTYRLDLVIDP
jgi:hypothetical protein